MKYPRLTREQLDALRAYQDRHGRCWKDYLRQAWLGGAPHDDAGELRTLRNTHGPSWLVGFRFPVDRSRSTDIAAERVRHALVTGRI